MDEPSFFLKHTSWLFGICLFIHLVTSFYGWGRKLDDFHGFRQCQTAISTYYTLQDGFRLDYETPVLGKPWAIPMEFPLYQWLVAAATKTFRTPLDQTGRFLSLLFFYLSLFAVFHLLGDFVREKEKKLLVLCFILLNPTYLFWSRTFMMESLALFLGLLYIWSSAKAMFPGGRQAPYLIITPLLGTLAGLVKATTWVAFCLPCGLLIARSWTRDKQPEKWLKSLPKYSLYGFLFLAVPLIATTEWAQFADGLKKQNPLADGFLTSNSQHQAKWIFGDFQQRISPPVWKQIIKNTHFLDLLAPLESGAAAMVVLLILAVTAMAAARGRRAALAICLAFFVFPLLVFTNLYYVHDYYFYTNGMFLSIFIGITLLCLTEEKQRETLRILAFILVPGLLAFSYWGYFSAYHHLIKHPSTITDMTSKVIRDNTRESDVVLIYGLDFDPTIPYYSQRKALMDRWEMPLDDPKMKKALEALGDARIGGMLIYGSRSKSFIGERLNYFHLGPEGFILPASGDFLGFLFFPKGQ